MGDEGLSNAAETRGKQQVLQQRGAKRGAANFRTTLPTLALGLSKQLTQQQRLQLVELLG